MLISSTIALPCYGQTEKHFSRQQQGSANIGNEYKLNRLMAIPDDFHKEVREGCFDVGVKSGLLTKSYNLVPQFVPVPYSYLILQVMNNSIFGLSMLNPTIITDNNTEFLIKNNQEKSSLDHSIKNKYVSTLMLFRLNNFYDGSGNNLIWLNYSTSLLGPKTSVIVELKPLWFVSHAFSSNGEVCCQFKSEFHYLDPKDSFTKTCTDPMLALEYAKMSPYPMSPQDKLALSMKKTSKYI